MARWLLLVAMILPHAAGAEPNVVVSGQWYAIGLLVDGQSLYWTNDENQLRRAPKAGGEVTVLERGDPIYDLALLGDQLFYSTVSGIHRISIDGRDPQLLVPLRTDRGLDAASRLVAGADGIVFVRPWLNQLLAAPRSGGPASALDKGTVGAFAIDGGWIYFAPFRGNSIGDRDALFWLAWTGTDQAVTRYRKRDGEVTVLAHTYGGLGRLALDDEYVYFANHRTDQILRVAK